MSHRLSSNNMNKPNVINYDALNARMRKGKMSTTIQPTARSTTVTRNVKDSGLSKSKLTLQNNNPPPRTPPPPMTRNNRTTNLLNVQHSQPANYANAAKNPSIEVASKPRNVQQNRPVSQPAGTGAWAKVLGAQSQAIDARTFNDFDPLRTIHFLSKELQLRLIQKMPTDFTVLQMLEEIQIALTRIPSDLLEILKCQINSDFKSSTDTARSSESEYVKPSVSDVAIQTSKSFNLIASEKLHKHIEESSSKIEAACTQMEAVCTKLKSEKVELENLLTVERETTKKLTEQLTLLEINSKSKEDELLQKLNQSEEMRHSQEVEIKKLNALVENRQTMASEELKLLILELRKKKSESEREAMEARHKLTLTSMENEKLKALVSTRERQIEDMRTEMTQLQEVVNEQLFEFQNAKSETEHSSVSTLTETCMWNAEAERDIQNANNAIEMLEKKDSRKSQEDVRPQTSNANVIPNKHNVSGDSLISPDFKNSLEDTEIKDYIIKRNSEMSGDIQLPKKLLNDYTTTTAETRPEAASLVGSETDPTNIKTLIEDLKKNALSLTRP